MNERGNYTKAEIADGSIWEGEISWDTFERTYKPIKNHLDKYADSNANFHPFETYGEEVEFVKAQPPENVWTEVQGDCSTIILAGFHFVNRIHYWVTEEPWETGYETVLVSVEVECECYDEDKFEYGGDPECEECEGNGLITEWL